MDDNNSSVREEYISDGNLVLSTLRPPLMLTFLWSILIVN